jgi:hypothetical protein
VTNFMVDKLGKAFCNMTFFKSLQLDGRQLDSRQLDGRQLDGR